MKGHECANVIHVKHRDEVEEPLTDWAEGSLRVRAGCKTIKVPKPNSSKKSAEKAGRKSAVKKKAKSKRK